MTQTDYTLANSREELSFFSERAEHYDLNPLPFQPGDRILDVGCGNGCLTHRMARYIGRGWIIGIDSCKEVLPKVLPSLSIEDMSLCFSAADARLLPFADETFDVACTHTLLMHLASVETVLWEMVRVTRMGGTVIALGEGDWSTVRSSPVCPALDRIVQLLISGIEQKGGNPYLGRSLGALFRRVGLTDIRVKPCNPEGEVLKGDDLLHIGYLEMARPILEKAINGGGSLGGTVESVLDDIHQWCREPGSVLLMPRSFRCHGRRGGVR